MPGRVSAGGTVRFGERGSVGRSPGWLHVAQAGIRLSMYLSMTSSSCLCFPCLCTTISGQIILFKENCQSWGNSHQHSIPIGLPCPRTGTGFLNYSCLWIPAAKAEHKHWLSQGSSKVTQVTAELSAVDGTHSVHLGQLQPQGLVSGTEESRRRAAKLNHCPG